MKVTVPELALHWAVEHFGIMNEQEAARRITNLDIVMNSITIDGEDFVTPDQCQVDLLAD